MMRGLLTSVLLLLLPIAAAAQTDEDPAAATQPPASQGPMIVERIHSGVLFAPEVKATLFDKKAAGLVGGSIGWVADETFFIGGGGYWMPSRRASDRRLAYGGVVVQWFAIGSDRFGLSAKALLGGGQATLPQTITQVVDLPSPRELVRLTPPQLNDLIRSHTVTTTVRARQGFMLAEPEVNARLGLSKHVRLTLGAGYRFAGTDWRRGSDIRRRLGGATGSFGLQIGG